MKNVINSFWSLIYMYLKTGSRTVQ